MLKWASKLTKAVFSGGVNVAWGAGKVAYKTANAAGRMLTTPAVDRVGGGMWKTGEKLWRKATTMTPKRQKQIITKTKADLARGQAKAKRMSVTGARSHKYMMGGVVALGALATTGVGIMQGMNNQARDYMADRYLQDFTYSRSVLSNSRIGRSLGSSSMDRYGSTLGLSQALSATRHGR